MTKTVKKCWLSIFCAMFCLLVGFAVGLQTWTMVKADTLVSYTDEQLAKYDTVSVKDICGADTYTVPTAAGSYFEEEKGYTASAENTTGSTVFQFKLGINSTDDVERLITLRKAGGSGYRFWFGVHGWKVRIGTADNWVAGNMPDPVEYITGAPSEYEVEIGAINLADNSGVWQYVKINDVLVLSAKQPLIANTAYPHVCVGGNDTATWTLTHVEDSPVVEPTTETLNTLVLGTWAKENSTANLLYIDVCSNNLPLDMNYQEYGLTIQKDGEATSFESIYAAGQVGLLAISGVGAEAGTKITIPQGASFVNGTVTYAFGEEFSVWYNGIGWQTEAYIAPTTETLNTLALGAWAKENSTANLLYIDVCSNNLPLDMNYQEYGLTIQKDGEATSFESIYAAGQVGLLAISGIEAEAGTKITIPQGASFVNGTVTYTFGEEFSVWYNGTGWQTEVYIAPTTETLNTLVLGAWAKENSTANLLYIDVCSNNLPLDMNYQEYGLIIQKDGEATSFESIYAAGQAGLLAISGVGAEAGTKITIPQGASFVNGTVTYAFGEEFSVWYNGTGWQTEEYVPEQPLPVYTDEQLAVYDVISVKEVFGTKELVLFGSAAYSEQEMPYAVSAENTTNSIVFKFTITHTELETTEKLITLRAVAGGAYGYRFYMQTLKTAVCNNWTGIDTSITKEVSYATEVNALYDIEIGAIDLADGSGVWQYVKLNGELIHSNVRETLPESSAAIRIGTNAVSNWSIRDIDYDNLPDEEAPIRTGITTEKSDLYANVAVKDLEDFMADVAYLGLGFGTAKTEENNIRFERVGGDDRTPLIELKPKAGITFANNFAVKFASINNCVAAENAETVFDPLMKVDMKKNTAIELGLELCATNMGAYWTAGCGYMAYLVWDAGNDNYMIAFYPQGPEASTSGVTAMNLKEHPAFNANFLPIGERYTIEYGCFSEDATKALTMYVLITNVNGEEMYIAQTWDSTNIADNAVNGGYVRISSLAYERCAPMELLSVDGESTLLSQYAPSYDEALKVVDHDISDYMPIGQDGITYTTTSAEDSKNIINVRKFIVNTKNDMYLKFTGDYNLRMAFFTDRSEDTNCSAGYHVIFTPNSISVQSYLGGKVQANETVAFAMPLNEKVHVSVRAVQLYIEGVIQGVRLTVFVNGEEVVSGDFALQLTTLPTYFDGIMSGNGSVTIYPYNTDVTATNGIVLKAAKASVAIDKQIKLGYEVDKEIVGDEVSYRIVSGEEFAQLKTNANGTTYLVGVKDGKVKVVASITNEYGTFESETVEIVIGTGEAVVDNTAGCNGCSGSISGLTMGVFAILASGLLFIKKKED